jgi:SAM-dependent methyltransferase
MFMARLTDSLRRRGIGGSLKRVLHHLPFQSDDRTHAGRELMAEGREFDRRYRIETTREVHPFWFRTESANRTHAYRYSPISPSSVRTTLKSLPIRYEEFTFVDFGSGKGRALFVASEFPFRAIVGIEFAADLHDKACGNLRTYRNPEQKCRAIHPLCLDATDYSFPSGQLVLYLYSPFGEPVLARVVENLRQSFEREPRDVVILYVNPREVRPLDEADFLEAVSRGFTTVYRTKTGRPLG